MRQTGPDFSRYERQDEEHAEQRADVPRGNAEARHASRVRTVRYVRQERVVEDIRALERDVREREENEDARHGPRRRDEPGQDDAGEHERDEESPFARAVREMSQKRSREGHDRHGEAEREGELLAASRHAPGDVERKMERKEVHREARRSELVEAPGENRSAARFHQIRCRAAGSRAGRKRSAQATPTTNPPTCAQKATPPSAAAARPARVSCAEPIQNCSANQPRR